MDLSGIVHKIHCNGSAWKGYNKKRFKLVRDKKQPCLLAIVYNDTLIYKITVDYVQKNTWVLQSTFMNYKLC